MKKKEQVIEKELFVDYDMFNVEEVIKILSFYNLMEKISRGSRFKPNEVIEKYNEYRSIINNKSLEKKYDKALEQEKGFSIYRLMQFVEEQNAHR